jgi:molecular chaperone GrpE
MTDKSRRKDEVPEEAEEEKPKSEPEAEAEEPKADPLAEAEAKAEKYLDMARRLQADFDNYRKRTERDNAEFRKYACSSIVTDLLTVVDDLDRALGYVKEESDFVTGIRGVRSNLMKVLEANGLKEIPADGDFDPNYHEALCTVEGDEDDKVAEVFQKGYTLNGKVIRYSKVKVTKKTA